MRYARAVCSQRYTWRYIARFSQRAAKFSHTSRSDLIRDYTFETFRYRNRYSIVGYHHRDRNNRASKIFQFSCFFMFLFSLFLSPTLFFSRKKKYIFRIKYFCYEILHVYLEILFATTPEVCSRRRCYYALYAGYRGLLRARKAVQSRRHDKFRHRVESKVGRHNPARNPFAARFILQPSWHNNGFAAGTHSEHDPLHTPGPRSSR